VINGKQILTKDTFYAGDRREKTPGKENSTTDGSDDRKADRLAAKTDTGKGVRGFGTGFVSIRVLRSTMHDAKCIMHNERGEITLNINT